MMSIKFPESETDIRNKIELVQNCEIPPVLAPTITISEHRLNGKDGYIVYTHANQRKPFNEEDYDMLIENELVFQVRQKKWNYHLWISKRTKSLLAQLGYRFKLTKIKTYRQYYKGSKK